MDFLSQHPLMPLAGAGSTTSFAADVFPGRPSFEEIQGFQGVMDKIGLEVGASAQRKGCQLASMDLIIDGVGLLGIFVFTGTLIVGNAKSSMLTLLRALPEAQQRAVQETLRPFDYLDMLRVGRMKTVEGLRPYEEESEEEEEEEEVKVVFVTHPSFTDELRADCCRKRKGVTKEDFYASEFEVQVRRRNLLDCPMLALTNMAETVKANSSQALRVRLALRHWIEMAQERGAPGIRKTETNRLRHPPQRGGDRNPRGPHAPRLRCS